VTSIGLACCVNLSHFYGTELACRCCALQSKVQYVRVCAAWQRFATPGTVRSRQVPGGSFAWLALARASIATARRADIPTYSSKSPELLSGCTRAPPPLPLLAFWPMRHIQTVDDHPVFNFDLLAIMYKSKSSNQSGMLYCGRNGCLVLGDCSLAHWRRNLSLAS
jgi:hypothetical protein